VPGDLGDALLNMWILAWGFDALPGLLTGSLSVDRVLERPHVPSRTPWHWPCRNTLIAQVMQGAPIFWLTGNVVAFTYNLLFLSTYILSAAG
jgi:hypothetical protein